MTTDRVNGFVIDRGVTLLGKDFHRMKSLAARFGLQTVMPPVDFAVGVHHADRCQIYRSGRFDDLLRDPRISWKAKAAFMRLGLDMLWQRRALIHGDSDRSAAIDSEEAQKYLQRIGGEQLYDLVFGPGIQGAAGGCESTSRAILMQTVWNLLVRGIWTLADGLDQVPEVIAAQVPVRTSACVQHVEYDSSGVKVEASISGRTETLRAPGVIFAIPGQFVPQICPALPVWMSEPLARTRYGRMVNAAVALERAPHASYAGCTFAGGLVPGAVLELEHLRAPNRCPDRRGLVCAFLWDSPELRRLDASDASLQDQAAGVVEKTFPECKNQVLFVHLIRWDPAIAHFPPGRLREMGALRRRLGQWDLPVDLCGDYLDGLSSEGALRTGEQAAERMAHRLKKAA